MKFKHIFGSGFVIYYLCCLCNNSDGALTTSQQQQQKETNKNKRSLTDNINSGLKFAGKILGIDTASEVADLVSKAFSNKFTQMNGYKSVDKKSTTFSNKIDEQDLQEPQSPPDIDESLYPTMVKNGPGLLGQLLRIIGLDGDKIGSIAFNGIIFIAQMIGRSLISSFTNSNKQQTSMDNEKNNENDNKGNFDDDSEQEKRSVRPGSVLDWVLDNKSQTFTNNLINVRDKMLPQRLVDMIGTIETKEGETDCIKLLLCKSAPIIWGMQRAISDRTDGVVDEDNEIDEVKMMRSNVSNKIYKIFKYIPEVDEFKNHGDACELRYNSCKILNDL